MTIELNKIEPNSAYLGALPTAVTGGKTAAEVLTPPRRLSAQEAKQISEKAFVDRIFQGIENEANAGETRFVILWLGNRALNPTISRNVTLPGNAPSPLLAELEANGYQINEDGNGLMTISW